MSYLARLKQEISQNGARGELTELTKGCRAFQKPSPAARDQWQEFESLLEIVAPAYNTQPHELDEIQEAARNDLASALIAYRFMAKEVRGDSK